MLATPEQQISLTDPNFEQRQRFQDLDLRVGPGLEFVERLIRQRPLLRLLDFEVADVDISWGKRK